MSTAPQVRGFFICSLIELRQFFSYQLQLFYLFMLPGQLQQPKREHKAKNNRGKMVQQKNIIYLRHFLEVIKTIDNAVAAVYKQHSCNHNGFAQAFSKTDGLL